MMPSKPRGTHSSDSSLPAAQATPKPKTLRLVPRSGGQPPTQAGATLPATKADAPSLPPASNPATGTPGDLAAEDRDLLLSAIKTRLRFAATAPPVSMPLAQRREVAVRARANVLDCVAALDRLHLMLTADADRIRQCKLDAFDAVAAPLQPLPAFGPGDEDDAGHGRRTSAPDPLLLLPNRSGFLGRLRRAFSQARLQPQQFAVLAFDLEGFKTVQASLGAAAADELLGIVASRLVRAVRGHDMVSRLSADQFGLFISTVSGREQLRRLTCKLFDAVVAPIAIGRREVSVRPNIGIAIGLADGTSGETLIKSADKALGHARQHKTGYAFFDERGGAWVPGRV